MNWVILYDNGDWFGASPGNPSVRRFAPMSVEHRLTFTDSYTAQGVLRGLGLDEVARVVCLKPSELPTVAADFAERQPAV